MVISCPSHGKRVTDNPRHRIRQAGHRQVGGVGTAFPVPMVDEYRLAAGALAALHVAPPIPDDDARLERDLPVARGRENQPRFGLATGAAVRVVVRADANVIELELAAKSLVHGVDRLARLST